MDINQRDLYLRMHREKSAALEIHKKSMKDSSAKKLSRISSGKPKLALKSRP